MRKRLFGNRRARYGWMTVLLTVLLVTTVILANVLFTTLAKRYSWYAVLTGTPDYSVTESCYTLLGSVLEGKSADVNIIFCNTQDKIEADATSRYVYDTAKEIAARFPSHIRVTCENIYLNPSHVKGYTETLNPATGEMVKVAIEDTCVIITSGDYYRVYSLEEFFVFAEGDLSRLWAYNGEKKLAAGILHAIEEDEPIACLTNNHGEIFYDYELLYLLDDAGYSIRYIDLYKESIPEGCDLIISYNPNSDMTVSDGVSATSEADILNAFLSESGNSFLVFLANGTPRLENFEAFLKEWGVETMYYTNSATNVSYRYMVQNPGRSLTSDGYTIYGETAEDGHARELVDGLKREPVFKNPTALRAANGFASNGDGSYTKESRTVYSLFEAGSGASSWANGKPVDGSESTLFALSEQTNADGRKSFVGVCASAEFATEEFLQSAVHGNSDTLMHLFGQMGKTHIPEGLTLKPFESTTISTVTTTQMWRWTLILAVTPAVVVTLAAVAILIKRRRA